MGITEILLYRLLYSTAPILGHSGVRSRAFKNGKVPADYLGRSFSCGCPALGGLLVWGGIWSTVSETRMHTCVSLLWGSRLQLWSDFQVLWFGIRCKSCFQVAGTSDKTVFALCIRPALSFLNPGVSLRLGIFVQCFRNCVFCQNCCPLRGALSSETYIYIYI